MRTPGRKVLLSRLGDHNGGHTMNRFAALVHGSVCYAIFFVTYLYAAGFLGNLFVPKTIDSGSPTSLGTAVLVNGGLLVVFALQHSVMARLGFKRCWTRIVPPPVERSTYVLASSAALIALFVFWQPMPARTRRRSTPARVCSRRRTAWSSRSRRPDLGASAEDAVQKAQHEDQRSRADQDPHRPVTHGFAHSWGSSLFQSRSSRRTSAAAWCRR